MEELPKVFTQEITVNKFDAEQFIAFIDSRIKIEEVLHGEAQNYAITHLRNVKSEAVKLLKI